MRVTRSTSAVSRAIKRTSPAPVSHQEPRKRQRKSAPPSNSNKCNGTDAAAPLDPEAAERALHEAALIADASAEQEGVLLHPALTFKFQDAKMHLNSVDTRWGAMIDKLICSAFEGDQKEAFNPFRSLCSSIIGQQVSWLAARAIQHKFVRVFYPHLPEKRPPPTTSAPKPEDTPFPTPAQIVNLSDRVNKLRAAGLSQRKVEYVTELAERFHDGRLSAKQLWEADDEEIMSTLTAIRGIGPWTVHMFLIFSSKRPNVLPVGDLGVQKNLCRWYSEDPHTMPAVHARKQQRATTPPASVDSKAPKTPMQAPNPKDAYPTPSTPHDIDLAQIDALTAVGAADLPLDAPVQPEEDVPEPPHNPFVFPETSNGLTPGILKARLNGKKLKGNIYLTPLEMEELMKPWEPYRSVACWYLWALTDGTGDP